VPFSFRSKQRKIKCYSRRILRCWWGWRQRSRQAASMALSLSPL
jgi:hypothetical protein